MWSPESVELVDVVIHFEKIMDVDPKFAHLFPKRNLNIDFQNINDENCTCDDTEEPVIVNEVHHVSSSNNRSSIQEVAMMTEVPQSPTLSSDNQELMNEALHSPLLHCVNEVPRSPLLHNVIHDVPHSPVLHNVFNDVPQSPLLHNVVNDVPQSPLLHNAINDAPQSPSSHNPTYKGLMNETLRSSLLYSDNNEVPQSSLLNSVTDKKYASKVTRSNSPNNYVQIINIDDPIILNEGSSSTVSNVSTAGCGHNFETAQTNDETCKISMDSDIPMEDVEVVYDNTNQYETCESSHLISVNDGVKSCIEKSDIENSPMNDICMDENEIEVIYRDNLNNYNDTQLTSFNECEEESSSDMFQECEKEVFVSNSLENLPEKCQNETECALEDCSLISDSDDDFKDNLSNTYTNSYYEVEYNLTNTPYQITGSWKEFNCCSRNNFTRGCKWAPDGSCILTCSNDNNLRIFNLPSQLWDSSQWCDISEMEAAVKISEGDLIYDYSWYPLMNSNDRASCCLASTSKKSTVHLWDGFTGELRCSYRPYNHLDEVVTPHSLSFDSDGQKLFCGFKNIVRIFNVDVPGRSFESRHVFAKKRGQSGIISCFAFTPSNKNISVAGSYQKTIGIYSEPSGQLECVLEGQKNGITQLQFSPDGRYLYSGGRKDPDILCWDLRNLGTVLYSLKRSCETNQRMYFDISRCGKYVVSGNGNGIITFWDVTKEPEIINDDDWAVIKPLQFFLGHNDCVNGTSLHPTFPLLCSSSGQRKFPALIDEDDDEKAIFSSKLKCDNSLRLWWIGKCY